MYIYHSDPGIIIYESISADPFLPRLPFLAHPRVRPFFQLDNMDLILYMDCFWLLVKILEGDPCMYIYHNVLFRVLPSSHLLHSFKIRSPIPAETFLEAEHSYYIIASLGNSVRGSVVGIYKRKQERKKTRKHAFHLESDQEKKKKKR